MRKMLMVLGLSIILANAQTERVKGCGEKPNGSKSLLTVTPDNKFVGMYISPQHYLITHRSYSTFTPKICEDSKKDVSASFPGKKATFIGNCTGLHGFFIVEDTTLKHDFFACLPTEPVKNKEELHVITEESKNQIVKVQVATCPDIVPQKVCFEPPVANTKEHGHPVYEVQGGQGAEKYIIQGIGIYGHGKVDEFVSVFHHVETICETMGPSFCEKPTTIAPTTTEPTTEAPTTSADISPSPTTTEPAVSVTVPSTTAPVPSPTPAATPAAPPASTQTPEKKTSRPNTSGKKKKTSKAPEGQALKIQGPEALQGVLEECNDKFLCFNDDDFNSAGGHRILMAIGMILVMVLF